MRLEYEVENPKHQISQSYEYTSHVTICRDLIIHFNFRSRKGSKMSMNSPIVYRHVEAPRSGRLFRYTLQIICLSKLYEGNVSKEKVEELDILDAPSINYNAITIWAKI